MTKALRAIRDRNRLIGFLVQEQKTLLYPILFAILCFASALSGKAIYVPIFWFFCATIVFAALFTDDNKVFLTPMLLIYYGLGQDRSPNFKGGAGEIFQTFDIDGLLHLCISGGIMIAAVLVRFALDGTLLRAFRKRGICFYGILALDAAFLLNGAFGGTWSYWNLLYGAFFAMGITLFYCIVLSMLDSSHEPVLYGCQVMVCMSYMVLAQFAVIALKAFGDNTLFYRARSGMILFLDRNALQLPWGIANLIGAVLALGIPAAFYLARNRRFSGFSYVSALLFLVGCVAINTRSATLIGSAAFVFGVILCCVGGTNKKKNRIYTAFLILAVLLALVYIHREITPLSQLWDRLMYFLRFSNLKETGRRAFWANGWQDFLRSPIFGAGFSDGAHETLRPDNNVFSNMYHNLGIELLGAMGILGVLAMLLHLRGFCEILFRRFSTDRLLLLAVPAMILGMSLVDNFFFYLNFQIFYAIFLALAEHELEDTRRTRLEAHVLPPADRKPRVVFSYIEAGKGHIVPERAVCDAFRQAYGDRADILESRFYTETGNADLEATEKLFARAVKQQNKNYILSLLCRTGNLLCGDCFALYFLMTQTCSGRRSRKHAMAHMEKLQADVLFTTHWSTAFYANRMKQHRPYVVCLCPDAYSNGMFNVDANLFLLPTAEGVRRAEHRRMYAGGSIREVPFPIRSEAYALRGKKSELRASLGIRENDFVVTLSDGGYGMARLEKTVAQLQKSDTPMVLIALCGTNRALYERLSALPTSEKIRLIPVPFTENPLPYIAVADLFCGKSGANSMAEPAFFGIPILITKCITYIEKDIRNYYVRTVGGAIYLPSAKKAARQILSFAKEPALLEPYRQALANRADRYGADAIAKLLWDACN